MDRGESSGGSGFVPPRWRDKGRWGSRSVAAASSQPESPPGLPQRRPLPIHRPSVSRSPAAGSSSGTPSPVVTPRPSSTPTDTGDEELEPLFHTPSAQRMPPPPRFDEDGPASPAPPPETRKAITIATKSL